MWAREIVQQVGLTPDMSEKLWHWSNPLCYCVSPTCSVFGWNSGLAKGNHTCSGLSSQEKKYLPWVSKGNGSILLPFEMDFQQRSSKATSPSQALKSIRAVGPYHWQTVVLEESNKMGCFSPWNQGIFSQQTVSRGLIHLLFKWREEKVREQESWNFFHWGLLDTCSTFLSH